MKNSSFIPINFNFWRKYHTIKNLTIVCFLFFINLVLLSCNSKTDSKNNFQKYKSDFREIDNLYKAGHLVQVTKSLDSLKPLLSHLDVESLTSYYIFRSQVVFPNKDLMNLYADSLLGLFAEEEIKTEQRTHYIRALILKSDVYLHFKQYDKTLEYYFKVRSLLDKGKDPANYCDFISKIAQIYYLQGKFKTAAKFQIDAYNALQETKDIHPSHLFYLTQGTLNNAGFSYERADELDSALYFYQKNLNYILDAEKKQEINTDQIKSAKIVALDNIGGLYGKKGNYELAQNYLEQCIAINDRALNPDKIPALIKLSKVYSNQGKIHKADSILSITEVLANQDTSLPNLIKLYKAKGDLALETGNYKVASENLKLHNIASDSLNKLNSDLSKINIDQTFKYLEDKRTLEYLEKINQNKTVYLVGAIIFMLMLLVIVWLVLKNAKQAKKVQLKSLEYSKQLEKTMHNLENRNRDYAKMMKVMAHDLKNPIGGMMGIAHLLLQEDESRFTADDREMLQLIESSGENSIEMINQLLNSGLAIENEVLKKESIDIQQLLRQCTELLQYKADEKKQKIIFISSEPIIISISREKIWRAFNNLIVNAIKFSPHKTEIIIVLERLAFAIRVKIIDQGIGVPDTDKQKIFEMFTNAKRPGTAGEQPFGIGLSISKQIIESHDGKIWLEDNPEGGTIFFVELPL